MKTKTKLLKQREIEEDTKTYEQVCKEFETEIEAMINATASVWIEKFCDAIKHDHPDWNRIQIRGKVLKDWARPKGSKKAGWTEITIRNNWPTWMISEKASNSGKTRSQEGRQPESFGANWNKNLRSKPLISQEDQERDEENEPVSSMPMDEYEETHPKTETSPFQTKGEINRAIHTLFGRLTGINHMPHMEDDVKKQYVIETRERAKDIINGISKIERDFLYNWLTWLGMVMDDWTNLLEKSDKTAYDTRE